MYTLEKKLLEEPKKTSFTYSERNAHLLASSKDLKKTFLKTGTTIVGMIFKDGVVLAADTRSTVDKIVADKNCEKLHFISENIYCAGAGVAADTEHITEMVSSRLSLHSLRSGEHPRVVSAMTMLKDHLFKHMGYLTAALILGGVDATGPHLYSVWPHGSVDCLPYLTMGSGSVAAMSFLEARYEDGLEEEAAIGLIGDAIEAGILNDLGSGSNVDIVVIKKDGTRMMRNVRKTGTISGDDE
ncbi:Proteasome subunit beta type-7-B [Aduncisulcus paluster]|uniref:Proteasome subunit beta n=1 Tax=Aduncisulcus paluster TaxID=2918883 RepID=A0ABQ5JYY1_9EUKA|nr:Proteasome subunit beta type-7-B [Aduncisulcus paluster]|eukprot:gnl/Carplike_NY0171/2613_a3511_663.p1 GENE.gnl/Carplike_NY0171/2613_a3511_663~~gnl/Carplike_NY0171/2613_a3511_663.p1  ORF type:complete len:242 (-),score=67.56 gnl/Carplike_NY0171/2613_a3511_663:125-850(-)